MTPGWKTLSFTAGLVEIIHRQETRTIDVSKVFGHGNDLAGTENVLRQLGDCQIGRPAHKHETEEDLAILRNS